MRIRSWLLVVALLAHTLAWGAPRSIQVPMTLLDQPDTILLHLSINGADAEMLLDTGASHTEVDPRILGPLVPSLSAAQVSQQGQAPGVHGSATLRTARVTLGRITWPSRTLHVMNFEEVSRIYGRRIDGLLGQDILQEFDRVVIDFKARTLTLER
jgi:hypothetical protein